MSTKTYVVKKRVKYGKKSDAGGAHIHEIGELLDLAPDSDQTKALIDAGCIARAKGKDKE